MTNDRHDLPCWCGEGDSCCSLFSSPKPHLHCFKCDKGNWNLTEEEVEEYRLMESNLLKLHAKDTEAKGNNLNMDRTGLFPQRGIISAMEDRGINKATAEKYGVETLFDTENKAYGRSFPSITEDNMLAQKVKRFDKKMKWLYPDGSMPKDLQLFGQHLFPAGGKYLTITEGEEDAQACYQMLKEANPGIEPAVVSLNNGVASAEKECKTNWKYINSFDTIVIAFDGDEPGKKAAEKVSRLFDYSPKIVAFSSAKKVNFKNEAGEEATRWELKDSNDYLKSGKQRDFVKTWWRAEKITPKGVVTFKSLWDSMTKENQDIVVPFPWDGLNEKLHGIHTGKLYIIKAQPKMGKTQILRELAYKIRSDSDHNVGLIFLEDTKKSIGMGMCALHMNTPIQFPDIPYELSDLEKAHEYMSADDRLTIFDPEDDRSVDNVMSKIMYFVKAHDCKFVILDHISMLSYTSGDDNERRFLDKLVADLKALTAKLNIAILAVIHVNDEGKTRGSRAPVQLCDALIHLERDKMNKDPIIANTTEVIVEENRLTGDSGTACKLFFDRTTGRLTEMDSDLSMNIDEERTVQFDE